MHFNFHMQGIRFCFTSTFVKLQECNDISLNFNSVVFFLLTLYCVLSHDLFSLDPWKETVMKFAANFNLKGHQFFLLTLYSFIRCCNFCKAVDIGFVHWGWIVLFPQYLIGWG